MNLDELTITVLAEEADELVEVALRLSKWAHKALRFGIDSVGSKEHISNAEGIKREFNDVLTAMKRLDELGLFPNGVIDENLIAEKHRRLDHYEDIAEEIGVLRD